MDFQIDAYSNKKVPFRFAGVNMEFSLSHGLFSSFDIDSGSRLLLKVIAARYLKSENIGNTKKKDDAVPAVESVPTTEGVPTIEGATLKVLDSGSGVGVLGVALAKALSQAHITFQDRDALACAFTSANANRNQLEQKRYTVMGSLLLEDVRDTAFDLIVSNIPAKAGDPVLEAFFYDSVRMLTPTGRLFCVIVEPLAQKAALFLSKANATVIYSEKGPGYTVFECASPLFNSKIDAENIGSSPLHSDLVASRYPESLSVYPVSRRLNAKTKILDSELSLETSFGLADFDTPDIQDELLIKLCARKGLDGSILVYNPGQGWLPKALAEFGILKTGTPSILASRDLLALKTSKRNLDLGGYPNQILHVPAIQALTSEAKVKNLIVRADIIPEYDVQGEILESAKEILTEDGLLYIADTSTQIARLEKRIKSSFTIVDSIHHKGFKALAIKRKA